MRDDAARDLGGSQTSRVDAQAVAARYRRDDIQVGHYMVQQTRRRYLSGFSSSCRLYTAIMLVHRAQQLNQVKATALTFDRPEEAFNVCQIDWIRVHERRHDAGASAHCLLEDRETEAIAQPRVCIIVEPAG